MPEFTPYLSDLNRRATPVADNEQQQLSQSERMADRWRNFLERKRRSILAQSSRSFWTAGLPRGSRSFINWSRAAFARRNRELEAQRLEAEIQESRADLQRYVLMAQYAINLAVRQDSDPVRRLTRKRNLMDRWRRLYQKPRSI